MTGCRVGVGNGEDDPGYARINECPRAGRGSTGMPARLQRDESRRAKRPPPSVPQGHNLGMRLTRTDVIALADYGAVGTDDDATDDRIGTRRSEAELGERNGPTH